MKDRKILIADDSKPVIEALKIVLNQEFHSIHAISNPNLLLSQLEQDDYHVLLLDMNFHAGVNTGNEGIYWLTEVRKKFPHIEVVMITAYGSIELAVKALKAGATDFILKPWDNEKLIATLNSAYRLALSNREIDGLRKRENYLKAESFRKVPVISGESAAMQEIIKLVEKIANTDANVLVTGENGTGKELIARLIHHNSNRKDELFVHLDLSSIAESLFESELFGHKKGAFTDALEDKTGKFTLADRGTLFLDEIGNIPLNLQSKLLNVLQTRVVRPVGSNAEIPVDIRLICATNKNLELMVASGSFRSDLLFRMNTIQIHLPPLRERTEDIASIANYYCKHYSNKYGKPSAILTDGALSKLLKYPWPGNIRELQHSIEKAVILSEKKELDENDFIFRAADMGILPEVTTIESMEKNMITKALRQNHQNLSLTAIQLGITRQTLYNKLKKYEL